MDTLSAVAPCVLDSKGLDGTGSQHFKPTLPVLNFERLLEASHFSNMLDAASQTTSRNQNEKVQKLNQQLKERMKMLLKTVLDQYTRYLIQAFQMSVQTQLQKVSQDQVSLIHMFKSSVEQTLKAMQQPSDKSQKLYKNANRKISGFRLRLQHASNDVVCLRNENQKLRKKILDLTLKLKQETLRIRMAKSLNSYYDQNKQNSDNFSSQKVLSLANDSDNDEESCDLSASNSKENVPHKDEIWQYIDLCERHQKTHVMDIGHIKTLLKKYQTKMNKQYKEQKAKIDDLNIRLNKLAYENIELNTKMDDWNEKSRNIDTTKIEIQRKLANLESDFKAKISHKLKPFRQAGEGMENALESLKIGVTCQYCLKYYQKPTYLSACKHTCCDKCIKKVANSNACVCPTCKRPQTTKDLIQLPALQDIVNRLESLTYHSEKIKRQSKSIAESTFTEIQAS